MTSLLLLVPISLSRSADWPSSTPARFRPSWSLALIYLFFFFISETLLNILCLISFLIAVCPLHPPPVCLLWSPPQLTTEMLKPSSKRSTQCSYWLSQYYDKTHECMFCVCRHFTVRHVSYVLMLYFFISFRQDLRWNMFKCFKTQLYLSVGILLKKSSLMLLIKNTVFVSSFSK